MIINKFGKEFTIKWWSGEKLSNNIAIDTETELIQSPEITPKLVLTMAYDNVNGYWIKNNQLSDFFNIHSECTLYFWNAAFDLSVFKNEGFDLNSKVLSNKIIDGQILYRLHNIAAFGIEANKWSLDHVTEQLFNVVLDKDDNIRLTFGQYIIDNDIQYNKISLEHLKYAALDPIATYLCTEFILKEITKLPTTTNLAHNINLLGDIALFQVTKNGIYIDTNLVKQLNEDLENKKKINNEVLETYGYFVGKKGNQKVFEEICKKEAFSLPITPSGKISSAENFLEPYKEHPFINAYIEFNGFRKQKNFLNNLNSQVVHPRYNSIKVTSRSSCSSPNIQNMPRIGQIRNCFVPRPGHIFIDCDYSAIELCAISEICLKLFGFSVLAETLNAGICPHRKAASQIYKIPIDSIEKESPKRQIAKVLNFGLVADMSPATFVQHAASQGVILTLEESIWLKDEWKKVFSEIPQYWKRAKYKNTVITDTGFVRSDCSYTEYLNCPMQTKVSEGCKIMLYALNEAGFRVVAFIHDQVLVEHPIEGAEIAMNQVKQIMIEAMSKVIKNVKISVTAKLKTQFEK